jgi:hypothetical protein
VSSRRSKFEPASFVREAYAIAERMDLEGWKSLFADDGTVTAESVGITYRRLNEWDYPARNYETAFADMHRKPCADIFELDNGKIKKFDCFPEGSVILTQLGVISNLEAALAHLDGSRPVRETEMRVRTRVIGDDARVGRKRTAGWWGG